MTHPTTTIDISDPSITITGTDFIIHNLSVNTPDAFVTCRKWFALGADEMVLKVAEDVRKGLYSTVSLNISKHSCVVVCVSEKANEEVMQGGLFEE